MLKALTIDLTSSCNYKCVYCRKEKSIPDSELSLEEITWIIRESKKLGLTDVFLTGGEPLLHPSIVEILNICLEERVFVSLFTSCPDKSEKQLDEILSFPNLAQVRVSIESLEPEVLEIIKGKRSAYRNILGTVEKLSQKKSFFGISMTLNEINRSEIGDVFDFAVQKGASYFRLSTLMKEAPEENLENAKESICLLSELLLHRISFLRSSIYPLYENPVEISWAFSCRCPALSHTAYIFKSRSKIYLALCPYAKGISRPIVIGKFKEALDEVINEAALKNSSKGCLALPSNNGEMSSLEILYRFLVEHLNTLGESVKQKMLLAAIINRQLELYNYGYYPCWRSSPLFLHPIRNVVY
ncbi:MAG: radical SAM protein [Actinobacteria bacterium]|nr:radical SAM protein [Actinomycetota bacterium]